MAKDKKGFVYRGRERTVESVTRKSKQGSGLYDSYLSQDITTFKAKEGENTVRIMPPTWEDVEKWGDGWEITVFLHFNIGPDNGTYLCLDKMSQQRCPCCEARARALDDDERDALRPSSRQLAWVIDRDNEKAGPQVWSLPVSLFRDINARSIDKKTNTPILIDDPEDGYDLAFNREGSGLKTKYVSTEVLRDPCPLHDKEDLQDRWIEYIEANPLPDLLHFYDYEHIQKVLSGRATKKAGDDEAEEPSSRPSRRRAPVEEAEEEEPPARSSRRRSEPEEEQPSSRRRRLLEPDPDEESEEEPPFEPDPPKTARRGRAEAEETDAEEESPAGAARRTLGRLKRSAGR